MPAFNFIKKSETENTFKVAALCGKFDLTPDKTQEHFVGNIPIEGEKWNIGLIYGNSGTGKSSIAKQLFPENYVQKYDYQAKSVIDDLPGDMSKITQALNSVGFSSPPSWLKPYDVLSNGEKMRVDLARAILEEKNLIVFDEFTSVVDRTVAKIGSLAVSKAVRKANKQFVAVTCHEDVLDWLMPDWVYCTNDGSFFLRKDPNLQLSLKSINAIETYGDILGSIII